MRISAKVDYALRAMVELAAAGEGPVKGDLLSKSQDIPLHFLENILSDLRQADIIHTQRGRDGGYRLARPAKEISLADIIRAVDGPLASIRGLRPDQVEFQGVAEPLQRVWIAVRSSLRSVLETVTLADVAADKIPAKIAKLAVEGDAWESHTGR